MLEKFQFLYMIISVGDFDRYVSLLETDNEAVRYVK